MTDVERAAEAQFLQLRAEAHEEHEKDLRQEAATAAAEQKQERTEAGVVAAIEPSTQGEKASAVDEAGGGSQLVSS